MKPREDDPRDKRADTDGPAIAEQDWDAVEGAEIMPESHPQNGDLRYRPHEGERPGDLPGEDDDNPYQESDEALPDDKEEAALSRDPSKDHPRFDEV